MKMPRSHCENENVQFVQELAEVDGPFESPININFRDLPKLELPSLVWNHCEIAPKKMKITNTGHTVIISGKWKCERPFLTGGPLSGQYVFSQIHFHWGQDDCKGSEHQVCGEGFPLEMHVAHFKAEYATQENALREKDGMVVVVYLFKLQDEPNAALKKILSCLPHVKQACTSQVIDPRPIMSLCNPFTDDYFMYWGSVITPTCAHILLWIVCREPFGISRDQVNEFRKLCDASQQPICRNNRDPQPLHKRNVFHVNASKNLNDPLLPIKKVVGCFCKGSEETLRMKSQANGSGCQPHLRNQEDIEGNMAENKAGYGGRNCAGSRGMVGKVSLPQSFYVRQTFMVQRSAVKSVPQLSKWCGNDIIPQCNINKLNRTKSEVYPNSKTISQSCCFLPYKEAQKIKIIEGKRKIRGRKQPLASLKALSHIMDSLEALKNHTVKKLKEIESINQEIKGMKPFCQDSEDKRWLRRVEKMMSRQKRTTMKASKSCLGELKKLAREYNFNKFFDNKLISVENTEIVKDSSCSNNAEVVEQALPCSEACSEKSPKKNVSVDKTSSKPILVEKDVKLSAKAQQLIQSFFEDIKESEELQQTVQKDLQLKKISSFGTKQGDPTPIINVTKGLITQTMFNLGNLGDRFFAEVTPEELTPEELPPEDNGWSDKIASNGLVVFEDEIEPKKSVADGEESDKEANTNMEEVKVCSEPSNHADGAIPLHRTNVTISLSKPTEKANESRESLLLYKEPKLTILDGLSDTESTSCGESFYPHRKSTKDYLNKSIDAYFRQQIEAVANNKLKKHLKADNFLLNLEKSSSNLSTDSTDTQRMIIAKFHKRQSRKDIWQKELSTVRKASSKALYGRTSWRRFRNKLRNINLEGYYIKKKNLKHKRKKALHTEAPFKRTPSSYERSSTSKDDLKTLMKKSKWKRLTKTRFKLEIKKTSDSTLDSEIECSFLSPERKKVKLECKKMKGNTHRARTLTERTQMCLSDEDPRAFIISQKSVNKSKNQENVDLYLLKGNDDDDDNDDGGDGHGVVNMKMLNTHRPEIHPRILTRVHIPRSSGNETRANSRESTKKTARATSVDSRSSCSDIPKSNKLNTDNSPRIFNVVNRKRSQTSNFLAIKNRSLTSLTARSKDRHYEISQRVFVESIDLRMNGREVFEQIIKPDSPRQEIWTKASTPRTVSRGTSNENNRKSEREGNQEIPKQEFNAEFFTSGFELESSDKGQQQEIKGKSPPLKRCDTEKYNFLEKVLDKKGVDGQDNILIEEILGSESVQSDANRPYKPDGPSMKGDAVTSIADNKELHSSVSYLGQKKNPQSRSHSAESLNSMKKIGRRKGKKRPHCCKRNSRHYIRKNSSFYKKLNKTENRTINFFGLTEEEQLKIISVNVAKYLEQKLVEGKTKFDPKDEYFSKETEIVLKSLKGSEGKSSPLTVVGVNREEIPIPNKPVEKVVKKEKIVESEHSKIDGIKEIKLNDSVKEKKLPPSPRPVHNFIKLNKLMAGQYKRSPTIAVEKVVDNRSKNNTNEYPREENLKPKPKTIRKKKEKSYLSKRLESSKDDKKSTAVQKVANKTINGKPNRGKTSVILKKKDSAQSKTQGKPASPLVGEKVRKNQEAKPEGGNSKEPSPTPLVLQKVSQAKNRRVPAYMLTSYLPAPMEIVEKQQQKMNRYLLNMKPPNMKDYLTDVLNESQMKNKRTKNEDTMLSKELDSLIRLQMCRHNEISTNMENSMNYVKTLLGQDYNGSSFIDKGLVTESLDYYEPRKKGVVLTEMNEHLGCSSSNSDCTQDSDKYSLTKDLANGKQKSKRKTKSSTTANESGDSQMIDYALTNGCDVPEEWNSDSGYNCEISITLNAGSVDGERDFNFHDPTASKNSISELGGESGYNLEQNQTVQSCSQVSLKPHRKKRKENEISIEMKQKLLEILEEEIKREMEGSYFVGSENSSDTMTWKWDDTDVINRIQSTDSSSENIEVMTQISETMRQYLTEFIERRFAAGKDKSLDEERKNEDMS